MDELRTECLRRLRGVSSVRLRVWRSRISSCDLLLHRWRGKYDSYYVPQEQSLTFFVSVRFVRICSRASSRRIDGFSTTATTTTRSNCNYRERQLLLFER